MELRIIDAELWTAVQKRLTAVHRKYTKRSNQPDAAVAPWASKPKGPSAETRKLLNLQMTFAAKTMKSNYPTLNCNDASFEVQSDPPDVLFQGALIFLGWDVVKAMAAIAVANIDRRIREPQRRPDRLERAPLGVLDGDDRPQIGQRLVLDQFLRAQHRTARGVATRTAEQQLLQPQRSQS